jgi:hypothetical protein
MSETSDPLRGRIFQIRGYRVILDADLARLYGATTKQFNQAFKRNASRFPADFAFQLTAKEFTGLKSQIAASSPEDFAEQPRGHNWSQFVTGSKSRHRGSSYRPWAFTEHGAVMAANILRSPRAIEMSVYVVRAFIKQREALAANATILRRLAEIDRTLIEHDRAAGSLEKTPAPPRPPPDPPKRRIGFVR